MYFAASVRLLIWCIQYFIISFQMIRIHIESCHYSYCIILHLLIRIWGEWEEATGQGSGLCWSWERARTGTQLLTVLTMWYLCIVVFLFMHEEMCVLCKQKHMLVLNFFQIKTVLSDWIVLHSMSLLLHWIRKSLLKSYINLLLFLFIFCIIARTNVLTYSALKRN